MEKKVIVMEKEKKTKNIIKKWENKDFLLNLNNHITIINKLFLNESFKGIKTVKQDIKKKKYNSLEFITQEQLIEKLVVSKLKCFYCKQKVLLLYEFSREMKQWTLDRLDNRYQHSDKNCVISCLQCNLQRRCLDDKKFLFTKQMNLIKKN